MRSRIPESVKAQFNHDNREAELKQLRSDLARLRELLGEVRDRVLVFGLYSPDLQSRIQSELKE